MEKNAWGFDNPSVNSNRWVVVGKYLSRINHSCIPNAVVTDVCTDPGNDFGTMRLISTRYIKMNDEILVEYNRDLDNIWLQPRERRRQVLQEGWGFICECVGCCDKNWQNFDVECLNIRLQHGQLITPVPGPFSIYNEACWARGRDIRQYAIDLVKFGWADFRLAEA